MNYTKTLLSSIILLALTLSTSSVSAIETDAELAVRISALRTAYVELKAEVDAGTLTQEEARAQWQLLIDEVRAEKEAFFEEKRAQIEVRLEAVEEKNPERAALIKQRIDAMKERQEERAEKRVELRAQIESGEITRQEANKVRVDFVKDQHEQYLELRANLKDQRLELRNGNIENRTGYLEIEEIKGNATERNVGGYIKIDDVKGEAQANVRVKPVPLDPFGMNALELFPQMKGDIQRATDYNSSRSNRTTNN